MNPFEELELDIVLSDRCCYCGACGAFCKYGYIRYESEKPIADDCKHCGVCFDVCPVNYFSVTKAEIEIFGGRRRDNFLGFYREILAGRATDESIRRKAQDGGAVTAILTYLIEEGIVESAVVAGRDECWNPKPSVARSREDLLNSAGSKYTQCPVLLGLREVDGDTALVGLPCHIRALRNAQMYGYEQRVKVALGLFCTQTFLGDSFMRKLEENGIDAKKVEKFDVKKGKLTVWVDGEVKTIPLKELTGRNACKFCEDATAEFADVSFGSVGSEDGWTTMIIRSDTGERIVKEAVNRGYLEVQKVSEKGVDAIRKFSSRKKKMVTPLFL